MQSVKHRASAQYVYRCIVFAICFSWAGQIAAASEPVTQDGWPAVEAYDDLPTLERNAMQARRALAQSDLFVRGWLTKTDPNSGLIPENLTRGVDRWNGRNNGALKNLNHYRGYAWERTSHDGYADSIECAVNLYNREPIPEAADWIDSQMRIMLAMQQPDGIIGGWHGDGNFARTAIMVALWKQQGVTIQPWREDVRLGAELDKNGVLQLYLAADKLWKGKLVFDQPRHKTFMNMPMDYPRINQFPEWFTVAADGNYRVTVGKDSVDVDGSALIEGYPIEVEGGKPVRMEVR